MARALYVFTDENHNSEGKNIAYISRDEFKKCDTKLHDEIELLVNNNHRNVVTVEKSKILYENTRFHSGILNLSSHSSSGTVGRQKHTKKREK
jgi:hypothetical protein